MASSITGVSIVCSTVYSGADQRKYQSSSESLAWQIYGSPVTSETPHKGPVTLKMFPFAWNFFCTQTELLQSYFYNWVVVGGSRWQWANFYLDLSIPIWSLHPFETSVFCIRIFSDVCHINWLQATNPPWVIVHLSDDIMSVTASQITGVAIVCSTVCSGAYQRNYRSSASLVFVRGIHRFPGPIARKIFPFDVGIMIYVKAEFGNQSAWFTCRCAILTHRGRVTHICVSKLSIIGSDNGLSPSRHQAIIWTNAGISLIRPSGTNFSEILIKIDAFSF